MGVILLSNCAQRSITKTGLESADEKVSKLKKDAEYIVGREYIISTF
jgi:hypothetical protein